MKRCILILLLSLGCIVQAEPEYLKYSHALGFKVSNISGYGLFYGYKPLKTLRLQATGIYYLFDNELQNEKHSIRNYSLGMEIQKDLIQEGKSRYYAMAGGYYYYDNDQAAGNKPFQVIKNSCNAGIGVGYEYFFHRVTLGFEVGYKLYRDKSKEKEGNGPWIPVSEKVSKIGAGLNLGIIL